MSDDPIDLDEHRINRPRPFRVRSVGDLQDKIIPDRDWLVPSVVLRRSITLFAGDGGTGMSQQLQVASALGVDWLGLPIAEPITSFGYYCEDDDDELDRRFADICRHYGCRFEDVADRVFYASRVGESDNELITFRGKGDFAKPQRTSTYAQVAEIVKEYNIQLTLLDTISDIFAGNENIRYQVKTFVTMIRGLALINNGGVILTAHPSKSAMIDGSGFSGSTAWNGAVRNRLYLTARKSKDEEGNDLPTDDRLLRIMKSNYGPFGEQIKCRWEGGVFIRTEGGVSGSILDRIDAKAKLMEAARYLITRGTLVTAIANSRTALTALARELPACKVFSFSLLRWAQDALLDEGRLVLVPLGSPTKRRIYIRPSDMKLPGEVAADEGEEP